MDILSHLLWTYLIFPENEYKYIVLIFAVLPDLLPSFPFVIYLLFKGELFRVFIFKKGIVKRLPKILYLLYQSFHSIPVLLLLLLLFYIFGINYLLLIFIFLVWLFHISIDIFMHDGKYEKIQFLFPFSSFSINGLNWVSLPVLIINYLLIVIGFIIKLVILS